MMKSNTFSVVIGDDKCNANFQEYMDKELT
jgi:hypothetical protein